MTTGTGRLRRRVGGPADDGGFTLVELVVSLTLTGVVLAATTRFLVGAQTATYGAANRQAASTVATAGTDLAQRLGADAFVALGAPFFGAAPPANAEAVTAGGVTYTRHWTSDRCHLTTLGAAAPAPASCLAGAGAGTAVRMLRVAITVTWPCRTPPCSLSTATLISAAPTEPALT